MFTCNKIYINCEVSEAVMNGLVTRLQCCLLKSVPSDGEKNFRPIDL